MPIYEEVENRIAALIENGVLKNGQKIPSLRTLSEQLSVSINTVREAYWRLENRRYIEAVPQSGYYVRGPSTPAPGGRGPSPREIDPRTVSLCQVYSAMKCAENAADLVQLATAVIDRKYWPEKRIARCYQEAIRDNAEQAFDYSMAPGHASLREQIALLGMHARLQLAPTDIIITDGCQEAVFLCLMTVCRQGDAVAVASPVYYSFLNIIDRLGLVPIEIPSVEGEGMNLDILQFVLERQPVKAVLGISNFANPIGASLSTQNKQRLLQILGRYDIPLIEDDIYGDLAFGSRPDTCKTYDADGRVLLCSSFAKTISPGLRLGWVVPGRYYDEVLSLKSLLNIGAPSLDQISTAIFLQKGGYEQNLRRMRQGMKETVAAMRRAILDRFPAGTSVTDPQGSFLLWVTLPQGFDTMDLYFRAIDENILIAPGCLFSRKEGFANRMRLSAAVWNPRIEKAIGRLGEMLAEAGQSAGAGG